MHERRRGSAIAAGAVPLLALLAVSPGRAGVPEAGIRFEQALTAAEASLKSGDQAGAERQYREALPEGWLLLGAFERLEGRLAEARAALGKAGDLPDQSAPTIRALALELLRCDEAARATEILTRLADGDPGDAEARRLLSMALSAQGRTDDAVARLDEASTPVPGDPELAFLLASEYLWLKRADAAERLFAAVARARPIPQTHVLIGRAYRDAGEYARARVALEAALAMDPGVRRAHYYLGMITLVNAATSPAALDRARAEFLEELRIAPGDPLTSDQLGLALLEAGRPEEALPLLETAVHGDPRPRHLADLARARLALDRPREAAAAARRGLARLGPTGGDEEREALEFQLGRALRVLGEAEEAAAHLAEAGRLAARKRAAAEARSATLHRSFGEDEALAALDPEKRREARQRVTSGLARAYFNLGVLAAQATVPAVERFSRAANLFAQAAEIDPGFPQVQPSLGIAHFNARHFDEATAPLARALADDPGDAGLKRMLATAWINGGEFENAVELLQDDPQRQTDPTVGFAYGLALLRSGRAEDAAAQLEAVVRLAPLDPAVRFTLGEAYEKLGQTERARLSYETARQLRRP